MNKTVAVVVLGALFFAGVFFLVMKVSTESERNQEQTPNQENTENENVTEQAYRLENEGLMFRYHSGEAGYTLQEIPLSADADASLVRTVRLTPTSDFKDEENRVNGEGSPSWILMVYLNTQNESLNVWANQNQNASNIGLRIGTAEDTVIAGASAITYTADGLYPTKVYLFAHEDFIFVVHAAYLDETSRTLRDLDAWLSTFTFIEPESSAPKPQGKIDVKTACESALVYMTFTDSAAADVFIQECIEGKHPEVIDRYIENLAIPGAAL